MECPYGQDERNCMRLSDNMGDVGAGLLEVFHPATKDWRPACVEDDWQDRASTEFICDLMGYKHANASQLSLGMGGVMPPAMNHGTVPVHKTTLAELYPRLRNCSAHTPSVNLSCYNYKCGRRRQQRSTRIIGGSPSRVGDWPFLAALLGGPEKVFYCAGVLISDQWLLTASHCVGNLSTNNYSGWTIQLGMTRRNSHSFFGQTIKVKTVLQHPDYNMAHDNDVALFQLKEKVKFNEHLLPVCLPPADYDLKPGTNCTVIGWGKKENNVSSYETTVNEAIVPILNRSLCNSWLSEQSLKVTEGMICAGYEIGGTDACQGDSGGPLLCPDEKDPGRWVVVGIVSWGIKCAHPRLPGVYAYVPKYVQWIQHKMREDNDAVLD